jgi:hypothetical protein
VTSHTPWSAGDALSHAGPAARPAGDRPPLGRPARAVMPDIPETAELEALIRALISKADDCLRRQLDDVRRNAEGEQSHDQDALADAS